MESLRQVSEDIAHDLRTPLTHLRHSLEQAQTEAHTRRDYERAVRQAIVETDRLLDMFAALLRIARMESGARRAAFRQFDLGEALAQAFGMYGPLMEDSAHPVEVTATSGVTVLGDRQLVLQLTMNLLDNVIHHTPAGAAVTGWAGLQDGCPTLVVADTGPGVPEPDRKRVLRQFYRLEKSRTSPGHGLGLSVVAGIVDLHEARITLSDCGPGLRVTIQFPPCNSDRRRAARASPETPALTEH